ncbi:MAG: PadR family transcriptional regulator [Acidimicrobiia bacterium]|nr:PadR family transcriptional regulator [Acidimicrobiia bacterium]
MLDLAVLGLLRKRPRHGYELKARLVELGFARVSFGSLYPALRRLEKRGLIEALRQSGRRKAYRLTDLGEQEFARILGSTDHDEDGRFNMRLAFFQYLEPPARLRSLKRRRSHLVSRLQNAQVALQDEIAAGSGDHYTAALLQHNVASTESDISFLDQLIAYARSEMAAEAPRTLTGGKK